MHPSRPERFPSSVADPNKIGNLCFQLSLLCKILDAILAEPLVVRSPKIRHGRIVAQCMETTVALVTESQVVLRRGSIGVAYTADSVINFWTVIRGHRLPL